MNPCQIILICAAAYTAGSIPSAIWAGKLFHGIDIREHGSRNAGATNTIRVTGWKTGIPVLAFDIFKGWLAASLPVFILSPETGHETIMNYQILAGVIAVAGHIFPVFAGFRGGKGVASTFGLLLALTLPLTLISLGIFLAILFLSGYVSLSSMAAGISFPILINTMFEAPTLLLRIFSVIVALALLLTHRKNIQRLLRGEEKKFIRRKENKEG